MKFAAVIHYTKDAATIAAARPSHREYLSGIKAAGKLVMSGPFEGDIGAVIVYEAESPEAAEKLLTDDPFFKSGVFTSYAIHRWNVVFANPNLVPELPKP